MAVAFLRFPECDFVFHDACHFDSTVDSIALDCANRKGGVPLIETRFCKRHIIVAMSAEPRQVPPRRVSLSNNNDFDLVRQIRGNA